MSFFIKKLGMGLGLSLVILLCFFFYKTQKLESTLEERNEEILALGISVKAGETTLNAILENGRNNDARMKELEKERSILQAQTKKQRTQLEEFMRYDEKSNEWARQEIPSGILSILLDIDY